MEDIHETMFVNPIFSQQPAPPLALAAFNETIFHTAILVLGMNVEPTITFDCKLNKLVIPNLQQNVQYQRMPSQPPPSFTTRNNQLCDDNSPFSAVFQIKPKNHNVLWQDGGRRGVLAQLG